MAGTEAVNAHMPKERSRPEQPDVFRTSYDAELNKDDAEHGDEHGNDNRTPKEVLVRVRMGQTRCIDHV
ncbi:MAG: hypothetical protein K0Q77_2512, partial [Anaerosporomusa subterranea]|nr:hypothetical protein [Anaerosporomusa subterranea]